MIGKTDAEEIMSLAFMPVRAGKYGNNGHDFGIIPGNARAHSEPAAPARVEIIIHDFHLSGCQPVDPGNGIQGVTSLIQNLGASDHLVRGNDRFGVASTGAIIQRLKGDCELGYVVWQRGRRRRRGRGSGSGFWNSGRRRWFRRRRSRRRCSCSGSCRSRCGSCSRRQSRGVGRKFGTSWIHDQE